MFRVNKNDDDKKIIRKTYGSLVIINFSWGTEPKPADFFTRLSKIHSKIFIFEFHCTLNIKTKRKYLSNGWLHLRKFKLGERVCVCVFSFTQKNK